MNDYSIALFLHIVGALGFFVALGLEWTGLGQIRSAMTLERVSAHHQRGNRSRPCLSPAYAAA